MLLNFRRMIVYCVTRENYRLQIQICDARKFRIPLNLANKLTKLRIYEAPHTEALINKTIFPEPECNTAAGAAVNCFALPVSLPI